MVRPPVHRIGCSGWQYKHWRGDFYPADLPVTEWLPYYARRFGTVEVNNSFYRLPDEGVFARWRERAPARFVFAVRASRFLTHMKKLKDPREPLERLFGRATELRSKLGPVLYQLPRHMPKNIDRLRRFLAALPDTARVRHAIEFRDPGWYVDEVLDALRVRNVALCLHDMPGSEAPRVATARFVYLRFHGATGNYSGGYQPAVLKAWAEWLAACGLPSFAYFNNDIGGHAPRDAAALRAQIETVGAVTDLAVLESSRDESTRPSADRSPRPAARRRASGSRSPSRKRPGTAARPRRA
jgi:uncharacterized protein YecE (DUF72 family)